jgi:hypothetical protein
MDELSTAAHRACRVEAHSGFATGRKAGFLTANLMA